MSDDTPLDRATVDQLIAEVQRRCTAGVIALELVVPYQGKQVLHRRTFGSMIHCRGIIDTQRELFYQDLAANIGVGPPDAHEGT